jgi:hypothetical protein
MGRIVVAVSVAVPRNVNEFNLMEDDGIVFVDDPAPVMEDAEAIVAVVPVFGVVANHRTDDVQNEQEVQGDTEPQEEVHLVAEIENDRVIPTIDNAQGENEPQEQEAEIDMSKNKQQEDAKNVKVKSKKEKKNQRKRPYSLRSRIIKI